MLTLKPMYWSIGGLRPTSKPNVGSVEPIGDGQPVIGLCLVDRLQRRLQVRARFERGLANLSSGASCVEKSNGPVTSNCSTGVRSFKSASS